MIPFNIYKSVVAAYIHPDDIAWVSWEEAVEFMRSMNKCVSADESGKTDQMLYNFCEYKTADFLPPDEDKFNPNNTCYLRETLIKRCKENITKIHCLLIDVDDGMTRSEAEELWQGFEYVMYSTHGNGNGKEKFRMVLPLEKPLTLHEAEERKDALKQITRGEVDKASFTASQAFYFPVFTPINEREQFFEVRHGKLFPAHELPAVKIKVFEPREFTDYGHLARTPMSDIVLRCAKTGSGLRYNDAIRLGCLFKQYGLSQQEFLETVNQIASPDSDYRRGKWDANKLWGVSYPVMSTSKAKALLQELNCTLIPW